MKIGIVDTMFSRIDMGAIAIDELKKYAPYAEYVRRTVPGVKDLGVVCKDLLDNNCDIVVALGMVGGAPIDTICGHEASIGIQMAKMLTGKQIIEVFVHENEAWSKMEFKDIAENRIRKHVRNAVDILRDPGSLIKRAGKGIRQGKEDEGSITEKEDKQMRVGIVVSDFHKEITEEMLSIIKSKLKKNGIPTTTMRCPGVCETPILTKKLLMVKNIDGVIVIGAIEKGQTKHGETIGNATIKTLQELALQFNKPVILGIIGPGATIEDMKKRVNRTAIHSANAIIQVIKETRKRIE